MNKSPVIFSLSQKHHFQNKICETLGYQPGILTIHHFPDEEILVKIDTDIKDRAVIFILSLDRPNDKMIPLVFAAETARELGATTVGLITPYLAYMRQDIQFHPGEGISSKYFAKLISTYFDWFITIDPHLHRWHALGDVFTTKSILLHATVPIANWIKEHVKHPVLIGPDGESTQWVSNVANLCNAPFLIVEKTRKGDTDVSSTVPELDLYPKHTPILLDDIISTGMTMVETMMNIKSYGVESLIGLGVHAIFANNAYETMMKVGGVDIVTCNTILHPTNQIDLSQLIIESLLLFYN